VKVVLSCFVGVLLAGCSSSKASSDAPQAKSDQPLVHEAKAAVISHLRDPDSAKFGDVYANNKGVVCGSVNAKNAYGGYVGFSAFWYDPQTTEAFLYDPDQNWGDKAYDALLFKQKGCSIGSEEPKALETAKALDESNKRLGLGPFGPKS
jgi:hypothetical protein